MGVPQQGIKVRAECHRSSVKYTNVINFLIKFFIFVKVLITLDWSDPQPPNLVGMSWHCGGTCCNSQS